MTQDVEWVQLPAAGVATSVVGAEDAESVDDIAVHFAALIPPEDSTVSVVSVASGISLNVSRNAGGVMGVIGSDDADGGLGGLSDPRSRPKEPHSVDGQQGLDVKLAITTSSDAGGLLLLLVVVAGVAVAGVLMSEFVLVFALVLNGVLAGPLASELVPL